VASVLPAHRHRFAVPRSRREIIDHHYLHLADIEAILSDGPVTLWRIAARLTWNRPWEEFSLALRRAAVNETAAHLRYLTRRNRATRLKGVRPFTFALPEAPRRRLITTAAPRGSCEPERWRPRAATRIFRRRHGGAFGTEDQ